MFGSITQDLCNWCTVVAGGSGVLVDQLQVLLLKAIEALALMAESADLFSAAYHRSQDCVAFLQVAVVC